MQAALDFKPHEIMKKIYVSRDLQSNKYGIIHLEKRSLG